MFKRFFQPYLEADDGISAIGGAADHQDPEPDSISDIDGADPTAGPEPTPTEPPAKVQQSAEDNAKFAAARRESEAKAKQEADRAAALEVQNNRLMQALRGYGYEGAPEEIADMLMAQSQGITIEQAKAVRQQQEAEDAKFTQLQTENEFFRSIAKSAAMKEDLATLKSAYPNDAKVQSLKDITELGTDFFGFMSALKDPAKAYDALLIMQGRTTKPVPPDIGAVNSSTGKEKDFYTPDEVDKLTSKDYDNPKIMERVRQSMLKWK
jgi:hypothetical protein